MINLFTGYCVIFFLMYAMDKCQGERKLHTADNVDEKETKGNAS